MADESEIPPWQPDRSFASTRLQSLRELLSSERHSGADQQRALDAFDQEMSERSAVGSLANLDRRRRDLDTHLQSHDSFAAQEAMTTDDRHLTPTARLRRRISAHTSRISRLREPTMIPAHSDNYHSITSPRRPTPPSHFGDTNAEHYVPAYNTDRDERAQAKRRKLDDGTFDDESRLASYGDRGRVSAGPLKLEIVSCDGGEYEESSRGVPQFVLQDDATVYTTKNNRCNLLLKHVGGMPFSLTKLVFKAARDGYDAPVKEGMIFVTMNEESLFVKTASYDTRYSAKSYRHQHARRHDLYRPSQEYMNSTRPPLRSIDRSRYLRDPYAHHPWFRYGEDSPELETALVPGFEVSLSDPSDSEELPPYSPRSPHHWHPDMYDSSRGPLASRFSRGRVDDAVYVEPSAGSEDSEEEDMPSAAQHATNRRNLQDTIAQQRQLMDLSRRINDRDDQRWHAPGQEPRRPPDDWQDLQRFMTSRRPTSGRADWRNDEAGDQNVSTRAVQGASSSTKASTASSVTTIQPLSSDTIAPHARFSVNRCKTAVAVNFEPAVSGRYILIKLWAACPNANIDIQNITAHGYGGPRFFPAMDIR